MSFLGIHQLMGEKDTCVILICLIFSINYWVPVMCHKMY